MLDQEHQAINALRLAVRSMCHSLDIDLNTARELQLTSLSVVQLVELVQSLNASHLWPENF